MKLTVIVPVYNVEKYLVKCLDGIVNQEEMFDEVILVNDGSTDSSLSICGEYIANYTYFKLINQENKGLSAARNIGIKEASGDYIMFLDSDDWLRADTVSILKKQLETTMVDAVYFDAEVVYEEGVEKSIHNPYDRKFAKLDGRCMKGIEYFKNSYPRDYVLSACLAIYKKEIIIKNDIFFPEKLYYEDNFFTFMFLEKAQSVVHISEKLYNRLYRADSIITSKYSSRKFSDFIKCALLIWDKVEQMGGEKVFIQLISEHAHIILMNYERCKNEDIVLGENECKLLLMAVNRYLNYVYRWENLVKVDCPFFALVVENLFLIQQRELKDDIQINNWLNSAILQLRSYYIEILKNLPMNDSDAKIGVYGTGKHTNGLMLLYEKMIGMIESSVVFIDSQKTSGSYKNRPLINYKQVDKSFDLIVISSFLHEREMLCNMKQLNLEVPIYSFYDKAKIDLFSDYDILLRILKGDAR